MEKRHWLLKKRKEADYTQVELSKALKISQSAYANIETGTRNPSVKLAKKIGRILDFEWTDFF